MDVCSRVLSRAGYRVTPMTDPGAALDLFRENPMAFDAVLTDQTMPGLTGEEEPGPAG